MDLEVCGNCLLFNDNHEGDPLCHLSKRLLEDIEKCIYFTTKQEFKRWKTTHITHEDVRKYNLQTYGVDAQSGGGTAHANTKM